MANPLLELGELPPFSQIQPEQVVPAITQILAENRARVAMLTSEEVPPTWGAFIEPLEEIDDRLSRAWSPISHLNAVMNSDALREAYNACLPLLSDYGTEMGHNEALYHKYRSVAVGGAAFTPAQRKLLENALRDFHLAGVDLPPEKKERFKAISQELSQLASRFEENLLDATNAWSKRISDEAELAGLPETARALARQTAEQRGEAGWVLTLDFPCYQPVLSYADNRALRRELYTAYATRASDQGPHAGRWDNGAVMDRILALRHELAGLLDFADFSERSLATKMARDPEQVMGFLSDLGSRALPQARQELAELRTFASVEHGVEDLDPWDIPYYAEKLRQQRYQISQEELRPYFPETRVVPGLFAVAERLFGIRIEEVQGVEVWHPAVRFFAIRDGSGEPIGQFYLDLYARPKKRGGAWMDECTSRMVTAERRQRPTAYLVCNFSPPVGTQPALFTHDEVQTLFHEFGHGLHHLLTRIDYPAVAGINGVPWDAVELPSQFLENWCWEREALGLIAGHWESGEPLPDTLYERMLAARNFQSAMQMVRQLEFSLFDFRIHREYDPMRGARIYDILAEVREAVAVVRPPAFNRFAHGFSHIFAGGYAAGYYSYKWAEVLSADAFSLFEERGIFDAATGRAFRESILEKGGSEEAMDLFVAFRGREPQIDALLRHNGIVA